MGEGKRTMVQVYSQSEIEIGEEVYFQRYCQDPSCWGIWKGHVTESDGSTVGVCIHCEACGNREHGWGDTKDDAAEDAWDQHKCKWSGALASG